MPQIFLNLLSRTEMGKEWQTTGEVFFYPSPTGCVFSNRLAANCTYDRVACAGGPVRRTCPLQGERGPEMGVMERTAWPFQRDVYLPVQFIHRWKPYSFVRGVRDYEGERKDVLKVKL